MPDGTKQAIEPAISGPRIKPSFREAFLFWLKLGFISFGGPAGQIAIMHEYVVEKKKWISDSRFMHALNYCMVLPGPEAQQLATYIGWLLHGTIGGLTAGILFILPSVFILLGLSVAYVTWGNLAWVAAVFYGLKPAVVAIIILALVKIGKKSLHHPFHYILAVLSFCCIYFLNIPFPYIIAGATLVGLVTRKVMPSLYRNTASASQAVADEHQYYLNQYSVPVTSTEGWKHVPLKVLAGVVLWVIPLSLFYLNGENTAFWWTLTAFFSKAAFVTFGGAYAVLPYVAQVSVEKLNWLSPYEMIDGLALGETTPGPLIMVLVFVGFMAAYNHTGGSLAAASLGLFTTTYYTFLPCFLFILIGAPLVERTKDNKDIRLILSAITAAVVGVILNLTIYFGNAVLFPDGWSNPDWFGLLWLIISIIAMYRYKVNMILWIAVSALSGLLYQIILHGI
jgi:chromate transporter